MLPTSRWICIRSQSLTPSVPSCIHTCHRVTETASTLSQKVWASGGAKGKGPTADCAAKAPAAAVLLENDALSSAEI